MSTEGCSDEPSSSDEDYCGFACGGVQDSNSFLKYDGLPHLMGKPPVPSFSVRLAKGKVHFCVEVETFSGPDDDPFSWDSVISSDVDKDSLAVKFPQKKTKRKGAPKSNYISKDCPIESGRKANISMFLARGFANFLRLQVDSC